MSNRGNLNTLLSLYVVLTCLPVVVGILTCLTNIELDYVQINNELAMYQLRRVMLIAYNLEIEEDRLNFIYHNDDYQLSLINNNLLLQPGTQIYLSDVDEIRFYVENNCLHLVYRRKDREYENIIGCAESLRLSDFSDCHVDDIESDEPDL